MSKPLSEQLSDIRQTLIKHDRTIEVTLNDYATVCMVLVFILEHPHIWAALVISIANDGTGLPPPPREELIIALARIDRKYGQLTRIGEEANQGVINGYAFCMCSHSISMHHLKGESGPDECLDESGCNCRQYRLNAGMYENETH